MSPLHKRILALVLLLLSIIFLPYWIYLPLLAITAIMLPFYWEALVLAVVIESLYGVGSMHISVSILFLLIIMLFVRDKMRINLS